VVLGSRMVRLVDRERSLAVIDRDVDAAADRLLDASAGTAAAGKAVDEQAVDIDRGEGERPP
jgi:hypothetical protein